MARPAPIYASMTSASNTAAALDAAPATAASHSRTAAAKGRSTAGVLNSPGAPDLPDAPDALTAPDALAGFHPAVAGWFLKTFPAPTAAQAAAWPQIRRGRSTLVAAPTGSGKTLTAFLSALDDLVQQGLANGGALPDETLVVYVSPLKAL
ncbi:MAG TPA: DEAD/DEAH box helicase, partial [Paraburkholderia sp.]